MMQQGFGVDEVFAGRTRGGGEREIIGSWAPGQQFFVPDVDGITPLTGKVDADFQKTILIDSTVPGTPPVVIVTEVSNGRYVIRFTPNIVGLWYVDVSLDETESVWCIHVDTGTPLDPATLTKVAEIHRILGLDPASPLCVSKTGQEAGDIILSQTEVGSKLVVQRES